MITLTTIRRKTVSLVMLLAVLALAGTALIANPVASDAQGTPAAATPAKPVAAVGSADAIAAITGTDGTLRFDVAEDATRFVFSPQPVYEDGMPKYGNSFVTQGYIYPASTLTDSNGVLADGSPAFPDKVLGQWTCRGWFVGEGMRTTTGAMVITTQVYNFGQELGDAMIISDGYELVDVGVAIERAITGGTGPYVGATGQGQQVLLGMNATTGVNLRFELPVTAGAGSHADLPVGSL